MRTHNEYGMLFKEMATEGYVRVASIADAVSIAEYFKSLGIYDVFRGQRDASWKMTSSAQRFIKRGNILQELDAMHGRFSAFAERTPEMRPYLGDLDSLWAVAQHFGLPTHYIDFTRSPTVAAFFASDISDPPGPDKEAVIFCHNSQELRKNFGALQHRLGDFRGPSIVEVNLTNLWRLTAQEGCFLYFPFVEENADTEFLEFHRIIFPYTNQDPCLPRKDFIYPLNQSALEQLVKQFFMNEWMRAVEKNLPQEIEAFIRIIKRFSPSTNIVVEPPIIFTATAADYEGAGWAREPLPNGPGWDQASRWLETHFEQMPTIWRVSAPGVTIESVTRGLIKAFMDARLSDKRVSGIDFVTDPDAPSDVTRLLTCVRAAWNGMRRLPFTDAEILTSLEVLTRLFTTPYYTARNSGLFPEDRSPWEDSGAYVEFRPHDDGRGAYSRGWVSRKRLVSAFAETFVCASSEYIQRGGPTEVMMHRCRPWQRFSFNGLRDLLVHELIPSQLVKRVSREGNEGLDTWIGFSPAELKTFGLA